MSTVPAGWFPDPAGQDRLRYWDGNRWTDHYAPSRAADLPPDKPERSKVGRSARRVAIITAATVAAVVLGSIGIRALLGDDPGPVVLPEASVPTPSQEPTGESGGQASAEPDHEPSASPSADHAASPPPGAEVDAVETHELGTSTTGEFGLGETATSAVTVEQAAVVVFEAISDDVDLRLTVRTAEGDIVASADGSPAAAQALATSPSTPMLPSYLQPGDYLVDVTAIDDVGSAFTLTSSIEADAARAHADGELIAAIPEAGVWYGWLEVERASSLTIDVRGRGSVDPILTLVRADGWMDTNDDRLTTGSGGSAIDPLLDGVLVDPGVHVIVIGEYRSAAAVVDVVISTR